MHTATAGGPSEPASSGAVAEGPGRAREMGEHGTAGLPILPIDKNVQWCKDSSLSGADTGPALQIKVSSKDRH